MRKIRIEKRRAAIGLICLAALLFRIDLFAKTSKTSKAFTLWEEAGKYSSPVLWPGFEPEKLPTLIFDGSDTYAFGFASLPRGFSPAEGRADIGFYKGQHPLMIANRRVQLDNVYAASCLAFPEFFRKSSRILAGTLIHEQFHIFQALSHPDWSPNDAYLFNYPPDTTDSVLLRRLEVEAFKRAVSAASDDEIRGWAASGLAYRLERLRSLPQNLARYEDEIQRLEGLAQYVEWKVNGLGLLDNLPNLDFAPAAIRDWGYISGRWLGNILDRLDPDWKTDLEAGHYAYLKERLAKVVQGANDRYSFSQEEVAGLRRQAEADLKVKLASRSKLRKKIEAKLGWRIEIIARKSPLHVRFFLANESEALSQREMIHTRWLALTSPSCDLQVIDQECLTESEGPGKVERVLIPGLNRRPRVERIAGQRMIRAPGLIILCRRAYITPRGRTLRIELIH
ncbi:MAG TPA: hypothetical protein VGB72_06810 [Acidobacteriota bacterium]